MKSSVKHVEFLDQFRGFAILAVLLFHTLNTVFGSFMLPWNGWVADFSAPTFKLLCFVTLGFGQAGVPIFFVVSGFCIHMSFQKQGQQWGDFFIRRIFRIYPAYITAVIFFVALHSIKHFALIFRSREMWKQLVSHLFLIHNVHPSTFNGINGSFWSLAVEAQLYLLYPILLVLVAKLGWRRTMIILGVCELAIRGLDGLMPVVGTPDSIGCHIAWLFAQSPFGYWFSWALGAFIADAYLKNQPLPFLKTPLSGWLALAIISHFIQALFSFGFLLFAVVTAVVTSRLLSGVSPKIKAPLFPMALLKYIGLWSYSIYLLHEPLLRIYSLVIIRFIPEVSHSDPLSLLLVVLTWLVIIPFSILWYKLFELPGIAMGKRLIQKLHNHSGAKVQPDVLIEKGQTGMMTGKYSLMISVLVAIVIGNLYLCASDRFIPRSPEENNHLAWSLATNPDASKRNGVLAVKLAEDACKRTHYEKVIMVGTLAAAYAEAGQFEEAISTAQQACEMARENGETNLLQENEELLSSYQNHQPARVRQSNTP